MFTAPPVMENRENIRDVHDDPAHEVRKVNNGLNGLFEFLMMKLVQKECQDDRNRESDDQLGYTNE